MSDLKIFAKTIEPEAQEQVRQMAESEAYRDCKIRIMPDCHAGKGCTVGTVIETRGKVVPNTVGVDIGAKFDIHKLLRKLAQSEMGILIISDDIPEIFACSDRVLVMKNGVISDSFNTAEINEKTLARAMFEEEVKA